jgi:tetratricopeptide (TPR) repeat protein
MTTAAENSAQDSHLKKFSSILTLSTLLAATITAQAAPDAAPEAAAVSAQPTLPQPELLPTLPLSEELMFKYLSAEIAEQRGSTFASYATMMSIARATRDPRLARRAAEIAMSGKLAAEALKAARLWQEISPNSEDAGQVVLSLQLATNLTDEAKKVLAQRLGSSTPATLPGTIAQTQRLLARVPDKAKSASLLKELLEPYRGTLDAKLALAQLAMVSGDRSTALSEAREATAKYPQSELAALTLAQIIADKTEASKSLADFLQKNPKSREVRMAHARMLFEQSKIAEARKEFKVLLQQSPNDQTALYALGLLSVQANELGEAETYLSTYIKSLNGLPDRERDATQALMILAQIAEDRNDTQAAMKWLDLTNTGDQPAFLGATLKRAQLLAKGGKLDAARALLGQSEVDTDEERIKLLIAEIQLLREAGQLSEAMQVAQDGLQRFPDNTDMLYEYAMVAEKNKQFDIMEQSLRKIMLLTPDNPHAYNALGYSLAERNERLPDAYDLLKKAMELAPEDPFIMDSMGWVEFRMGRLEKAEELLRRAYAIKPDAEIAVHLGEVLWVKGREDEAKKLWRNASSKDPKNETLKGTLRRLQVKL